MRLVRSALFMPPPAGFDGMPRASRGETSLARAVAIVATAWFVVAAAWELFGPILAGHYAAAAGNGIMAENMWRWRIFGPVWEYTATRPPPASYYCHHPWGIFWTTAAFYELLGRHDFVCRLPAVILSGLTPPLLYALGRALWRPVAGAAAALGFVVLPIALSFASFNGLEVPVIAYSTLSLWASVRYAQAGRSRHLALAGAGALLAACSDWPALVWLGVMSAVGAARILGARREKSVRLGRAARLWVLLVVVAGLAVVLHGLLFHSAGKLGDLLASYAMRSAGNEARLWEVLASRRYWLELAFTPVGLGLVVLGAILSVLRFAIVRDDRELVPLYLTAMAAFQYFVFRQGADIHVFWPHYFALSAALGLGALAATTAGLLEARPSLRPRAAAIALAICVVPSAVILRDAVPTLAYARATGGRFNEKGLFIDSDGDKTAFLRFVEPDLPRDRAIDLAAGMKPTWAQVWALGGRVTRPGRPPPVRPEGGVHLTDVRFLGDAESGAIAERFAIVAVGPFWMIDPQAPFAPLVGYRFVEREPSLWSWYFVSGTEPEREVVPDPFGTWELRTHWGQPSEAPPSEPVTFEERRIAHNAAVERGDLAGADAAYAGLRSDWKDVGARFEDGTEIVGTRFEDGVRPLLVVYVRAAGPSALGVRVAVESRVVDRAWLSTTMPDPVVREVGPPMPIASERWRAGFVYANPVAIRERLGTEIFEVSVRAGRKPVRRAEGGGDRVEVLRY